MQKHVRTPYVGIENVHAGMEVVGDVVTNQGVTLVPAGTVLDEYLIERLQRRGVKKLLANVPSSDPIRELSVKQEMESRNRDAKKVREAVRAMSDEGTVKLEKVVARIEQHFQGFDKDPVMRPLKSATINFWTKQLKTMDEAEA